MKAALICPVPELDRFVDRRASLHLLLGHLFQIPGYVEFYRTRSELYNDYIMVDNGAKENGHGMRLKTLLELGSKVLANEVVLTDVRFKGKHTLEAGRHELKWLGSDEGQEAYERAGSPRLMVVPQGSSEKSWIGCLEGLLVCAQEYTPTLLTPVVGIAYHYDHMFRDGLKPLVEHAVRKNHDIHLLGWTRRLSSLEELSRLFPSLRSVDSSRPFVYGKAGLTAGDDIPYPGRDKGFFTDPVPVSSRPYVRRNIELFRRYAGDKREV